MAVREIPTGSVEIQTGLWAHQMHPIINGMQYSRYDLYSAEGYCFYDLVDEYYDGEGNRIPESEVQPTQRIYYQYMILPALYDTVDKLNAQFVSVPVQEGFEIVSAGNNHEIM